MDSELVNVFNDCNERFESQCLGQKLPGSVFKAEPSPHHRGLLAVVYYVHSRATPIEIRQLYKAPDVAIAKVGKDSPGEAPAEPGFHIVQQLDGHTHAVTCVTWAPFDPKLIISGSQDGTARMWDWHAGICLSVLTGHTSPILDLVCATTWMGDRKEMLLVSGSSDKSVRVWRINSNLASSDDEGNRLNQENAVCLKIIKAENRINSVDVRPAMTQNYKSLVKDGQSISPMIATGSTLGSATHARDGRSTHPVEIWDLLTEDRVASFHWHIGAVNCVRFSPVNHDLLVSAGDDGDVCLWSISKRTCMGKLRAHTAAIWSISFAPQYPDLLTSASMDGTVRVWRVGRQSCVVVLDQFDAPVTAARFSSLSSGLITGSFKHVNLNDWTLRMYPSLGGPRWDPLNHLQQPFSVRQSANTIMLVALRWRSLCGVHSDNFAVPNEIWFMILKHIHIVDYCQDNKALATTTCSTGDEKISADVKAKSGSKSGLRAWYTAQQTANGSEGCAVM